MLYNGMFLRQYMGQSSRDIPNATEQWQNCPDLLVYGTEAAYITSNFNSTDDDYESRNWYFSQAPTPGKANYIYVRALSLSSNLTSTVYLFYCTTDTLLQPKNWKLDTFSVTIDSGQPVKQNFFTLSAVSLDELVISYDAINKKGTLITWTPPTATSMPHYYLIAWVDNSRDGSDKPPFATLDNFAKLTDLEKYVQGNTNMVFLDTWYQGMFLRQFAGQTNYQEGTGAKTSPDIILNNTTATQDSSTFASKEDYDKGQLRQDATLQMKNFIYIRGLNTASAQQSARVYLYYATTEQLTPASWKSDTFTVAGKQCNYVDISADTNSIVASTMPIVWRVDTSTDYILIAYVDNSSDPQPPDFSIFGYVNPDMIQQFVATQPRLTWLAVKTQAPAHRPDLSYEFPLSIKSGKNYVGLQFTNITTSGTVTFSVPGENSQNTLVKSQMNVPDPNAAVTWSLNFNAQLDTSLVLNFWHNSGSNGDDVNIEALVIPSVNSL